ncbi:MAG TPA: efflux RND transporter periplasmic adaptor subunit [Burkholderiaceae bacterium]
MNDTNSFVFFRQRSTWAGLLALSVIAAACVWALNHPAHAADAPQKTEQPSAPPPVQVTTAAVKAQDVPVYRAGIGTATAAQSVTVKARIDGQLDKVGFVEGQDVKAGQMLARIDPRTLQAQLAQAQAQRAKDQATLANARVDLTRYTSLLAEQAATPQQVDTQKALVAQLEAAVQTDDAQIHYAQVQLGFTTITAPIGGRVGARLVDPGNIVHATDANGLVVINQVDPISVVFTLPEEAFPDINRALNASGANREAPVVQAYARNGRELLATGKLVLLNNQIDTASGTIQLKGSFANPTHALWPGQYVNVRLVLGQRKDALTVPAAAVQRSPNGTYAYVVDADSQTVQPQPVEVASIQDGIAVIDKGLSAGQRVVVDGQYKLKPGARIAEAPRGAAKLADASAPAGSQAGSRR